MKLTISDVINTWDKWVDRRYLNIELNRGGIIKEPITFCKVNKHFDTNIKFEFDFFIENVKNDLSLHNTNFKNKNSENKIYIQTNELVPNKLYTDKEKIKKSREIINKNLKIYFYNKRLSNKIYILNLLYVCFIHSNIQKNIFIKNPYFNFKINKNVFSIDEDRLNKNKILSNYNETYKNVDFKNKEYTSNNDFMEKDKVDRVKKIIKMMHKEREIPQIQMVDKKGLISFSPTKKTYFDIDSHLKDIYHNDNEYFSSAMDILASYVKGQKLIYMEAESYSQNKLNYLMFPSIFASTTASVLASAVEKEEWGGILISSINATIAFFLSIISYLKLDAQSEAHKTSAHQYDKLQSICEFSSGNLLLFTDMKGFKDKGQESKFFIELQKTINSLETKIKEIKETNQFIIPKRIRHRYKIAYNINIFSVIKKIDGLKKHYVAFITEKINLIKMYKQQHNQLIENGKATNSDEVIKIKQLIDQEYYERNYGYEKYQLLKNSFGIIDQLLADEMEYAEKIRRRWFPSFCPCYVKLPRPELKNTITYLITDPFSALDNRAKITYNNYLKKMYQKYDMSKNIFALEKGEKNKRYIPTKINNCLNNKKNRILELEQIMKGLVETDNDEYNTYDNYKDYSCFSKKFLFISVIILVISTAVTAIVISIVNN